MRLGLVVVREYEELWRVTHAQKQVWMESLPLQFGTCVLEGASSRLPTLFLSPRIDGFGAMFISMLTTAALAAEAGFAFGGMIDGNHQAHGIDMSRAFAQLLGVRINVALSYLFPSSSSLGCLRRPIKYDPARVECSSMLQATNNHAVIAMRGKAQGRVFLQGPHHNIEGLPGPAFTRHVGEAFVRALRSQVLPPLAHLLVRNASTIYDAAPPPRRLLVAMHLRRGDAWAAKWRLTPDATHLRVAAAVRALAPNAEVHAYSTLETDTLRQANEPSRFDVYRAAGVHVHLRGDAIADFAALAHADVLVVAKSSFSYTAALLNQGCIIVADAHHRYVPMVEWARRFPRLFHWSLGPDANSSAEWKLARIRPPPSDLAGCLRHAEAVAATRGR